MIASAPLTVVLREYESVRLRLTPEDRLSLLHFAPGRFTVQATEQPDVVELRASSYVGAISLVGQTVMIRPKVSMENLLTMLTAGVRGGKWQKQVIGWETYPHLLHAMAGIFLFEAERATRQGLIHSYRENRSRQPALRGRLDVTTVMRRPDELSPVPCIFDDFTADHLANHVLRGTARRLVTLPGLDHQLRRRALRLLGRFEAVSDEPVRADDVDRVVISRINQHYAPALGLARLILRSQSLQDLAGSTGASAFLVDMNRVFQDWVTHGLRAALASRLQVRAEPQVALAQGSAVPMYPDLDFRRSGRSALVGDVKYKLTGTGRARNSDYYQLLAYATAMHLPSGILIYCQADEAPVREIIVRHSGVRLLCHPMDLRGSPQDLKAAMVRLADEVMNLV